MLKNGIEELRDEKYQQEKNGIAKALLNVLADLEELEFTEVGKAKRPIICGCNQPNVDNTTTPPRR